MAAALMMMGMGMSSCSNDDVINEVEQAPKKVQLTLTASFDMGGETRAVWDGLKPKFEVGDQVGVYSDNQSTAQCLTVQSVDASGATLTGEVTEATEYHLVFPYKEGTIYNKSASPKTITNFDNFAKQKYYSSGTPTYPSTALHYVKVTSLSTTASFKPLCAILKSAWDNGKDRDKQTKAYIGSAKITSPVIKITNEGVTVDATVKEFINTEQTACNLQPSEREIICFPVAPGTVTLKKVLWEPRSRSADVVAGKIYNVNMSDDR